VAVLGYSQVAHVDEGDAEPLSDEQLEHALAARLDELRRKRGAG
jgi:hypothetical protein